MHSFAAVRTTDHSVAFALVLFFTLHRLCSERTTSMFVLNALSMSVPKIGISFIKPLFFT